MHCFLKSALEQKQKNGSEKIAYVNALRIAGKKTYFDI
jgi:hypothetical protein